MAEGAQTSYAQNQQEENKGRFKLGAKTDDDGKIKKKKKDCAC